MARVKKKKTNAHYVDNAKFLEAMKEWKDQCKDAEASGDEKPRISNYIGECFLKIANHLSYRPNFINYTYREEMISDGIENCLQYVHNFNPEKSDNPFAYYTAAVNNSFTRVLNLEKRNQTIRDDILIEQGHLPSYGRQIAHEEEMKALREEANSSKSDA